MTNVDYKRAVDLRKKPFKEQVAQFAARILGVPQAA